MMGFMLLAGRARAATFCARLTDSVRLLLLVLKETLVLGLRRVVALDLATVEA